MSQTIKVKRRAFSVVPDDIWLMTASAIAHAFSWHGCSAEVPISNFAFGISGRFSSSVKSNGDKLGERCNQQVTFSKSAPIAREGG